MNRRFGEAVILMITKLTAVVALLFVIDTATGRAAEGTRTLGSVSQPVEVAVAPASLPESSTVPLLRIHATLTVFAQGNMFVDENLFIFADAKVTGFEAFSRDITCNGCQWAAAVVPGSGSVEQFQALRQVLNDSAVGLQKGDCSVEVVSAVGSGTYEVTWYGRNARHNVFAVSIGGQAPRCSAPVASILTAIETYARQAGVPTSNLAPFR